MRPIVARVSASALANNLAVVRRRAPNARVMAVIKARGYGHGLLFAARALARADAFAVCELEAAIELRDAGFHQPLVLLQGFFSDNELPLFAEYGLTPVLHDMEQIEMLGWIPLPIKLDVYLKINTGMNRLGLRPESVGRALAMLRRTSWVGRVSLMTHFACADLSDGIEEPLRYFNQITAAHPGHVRSLANSAALLADARTHADWVRPGIMLYGASPFAERSADAYGLRPVMTLASRVIAVQQVQPDEGVGYGALFRARSPMRVGIVACGYADGYPRHAPSNTPVLVDGQRTRIVGRVSMDMLAVDLTQLPGAGVGSEVTLWGEGLPADEVATHAGTIAYELFCGVAPRVPVEEVD